MVANLGPFRYIGQTLIRSAPVSERVNLQRMGEVDLVVLVGTETPVIKEGGLQKGSREQILFDALYMVFFNLD